MVGVAELSAAAGAYKKVTRPGPPNGALVRDIHRLVGNLQVGDSPKRLREIFRLVKYDFNLFHLTRSSSQQQMLEQDFFEKK